MNISQPTAAGFLPLSRRPARRIGLPVLICLALTVSQGFGYQKKGPPPVTPTSISPSTVTHDANYTLTVQGTSVDGSEYIAGNGSKVISAAFSGSGISVTSVSVTNPTTLNINLSISANASVGYRTLTITNPDGQTATSGDLLYIMDRPVIVAASITPGAPSSTNDLTAQVTSVINLDGSAITFSYQWLENGASNGYTSAVLPHQATSAGKSYSCIITPAKGTLLGAAFTTAVVSIGQDADNNGIQDEWELAYFGTNGVDPDADVDGDGLSNQSEYLFGLDPTDRKSKSAIKNKLKRSTGKFAYTRPVKKVNGLTYQVWVSTSLSTWTEQTSYTETVTPVDSNTEVVEVTLPSALITAEKKLFIRMSANP